MINAVVLIEADRDVMSELGGQLAEVISGTIGKMSGVTRTQTLVAFEVFSKHDLEALFDVGNAPPEPGA